MDRITHFEIPADDKARSKDFYSEVFEWQITDVPVQMGVGTGTYTIATTVATDPTTQLPTEPGAINGAIVERQGRITAPVITITVDSIEDSLKKVTSAGGEIIESKQEIANMGYYAYVTDPAGNVIGLWENAAGS
jgi:predicted enzyme related to lactoylglutathione lyase